MNTLNFTYQQASFDQWINAAASVLGTTAESNTLNIPRQAGEGYVKAMAIQPGLSFALGNFLFNIDAHLQIKDNGKNGYILYFRKLDINDKYVFYLGDVMKETTEENYETALLLSSRMDHSFEFKKGTQVMSLAIYMDEEWVNNNIDAAGRERLQEYVANGIDNYNKEVLTAKHKRIIETMLREDLQLPLSNLFLQTRAYRLTENFLNGVLTRSDKDVTISVTESDMIKLISVEKILVENCMNEFLSVEELAKIALMSETKLKKLFKQVYGMGLYEYYQKNRMHQAKEMLISGKYKISEIGIKLGYSNLSNFSVAFKKEFGCLPSEYRSGIELRA
jgi:AraC-like DNA-binding protein